MAYRLCFSVDGDRRRRLLTEGENLLGSAAGCDIRIQHASVSKHHAALVVVAGRGGIEIADLGSRNGTRVDGARVRGKATVLPGQKLVLGSVSASLEEVSDADARPSQVELAPPPRGADHQGPAPGTQTRTSATTASLGPLSVFMQGYLPTLASAVAEGAPAHVVAARSGAAMLESLPCQGVEIRTVRPDGLGETLFSGSGVSQDWPSFAVELREVRLEIQLPDESTFRLLRPLLETLAALVSASSRSTAEVNGSPRAQGRSNCVDSRPGPRMPDPRMPDPPSVEPAVKRLYDRARKVAGGDVNVLILGESGTGKELLARFLHDASPRRAQPFVAMNCAALARDLQEAELFGIERGVATGVDARPGLFEKAHGGTLFLDEIGDMAIAVQAQILRALQQQEVYRVGGSAARPADVRVISATHRDIAGNLDSGGFRRDLFHRIADWQAHLPPLRERPGDIVNLAAYFLRSSAAGLGRAPAGFSEAALQALCRYHWPGNIRQLEREIRRAVLFTEDGEWLDSECLSAEVREALGRPSPRTLKHQLEQAERHAIENALEVAEGQVPGAAEMLEVSVSTLYRKLNELGIR